MEVIEKRKIVPIVAKISSGKSTLLNIIYNIDFLECKAGIGTKFVNILRYNPNLEEPCFYHLKIQKNKEGEYIFKIDKNYEIKFGKKAIIEENKNINQFLAASPGYNYEDLFYITELNETGFIKDEQYLLTHDLCDMPGLSEFQSQQDHQGKIENVENSYKSFEKKVQKGIEQFGLVYNKIKKDNHENENINFEEETNQDDLYYQVDIEKDKTYLTEIFKIMKNYIDGIILVLSQDKFYFDDNFEIIAKLSKVIQKEINNSLVILNKIDLSSDPIADINKCKGLLSNKFPEFKTFNLNNNTFVAISSLQLQNELKMNQSFIHLIKYHFYNYLSIIKGNTIAGRSFIDHLSDIIFQGENGITKQIIKEEVNKLNKSKDIYIINEKIKNVIKELRDKFKADSIIFGIKEGDIGNEEEEEQEDDDEDNNYDNNYDDLNPSYIIKILYILYKKNKLIPPLSNETKILINYFTIKKNTNNKIEKNINYIAKNDNYQLNKLNKKLIDLLQSFSKTIKNNNNIKDDNFKNLINEIANFIEFLKIYNVIFIPFLGESNVGKSTIINGMIGKEILQTNSNECTKRGIIIKYINSDDTYISKAKFIKEIDLLGNINYFFNVKLKDLIGTGENKVKETLSNLNYEFNENEKDSFYYIKTRIKLFDDIGLNESLKEMVYLIDFPGFGTGNIFERKNIYDKVMSICDSFIFVVRNNLIKENTAQRRLQLIFDQAQIQKKKLFLQFIKSCLFVLNNEKDLQTTEEDLNQAKTDINSILNNSIDSLDKINSCFFNAKYYENYCKIYNYFYNLEDSFNKEYEEYRNLKSSFFKNPLSIKKNEDREFFEYIYTNIRTKIKELYDINNMKKALKNQTIKENVKINLKQIINDINTRENLNYKEQTLSEMEDKLSKIISLGQNKLPELKTLRESNINKFKDAFENQINYINKKKQDTLSEELESVINLLDDFFQRDFNERKKDLNEIENLKKENNQIKEEIKAFRETNKLFIEKIKTEFKSKIKLYLIDKKSELKKKLESKNYNDVLEEINNQIKANLEGLNKKVSNFIKSNEIQTEQILSLKQRIISKYSIKDYFKSYKKKNKMLFNIDICKKIGSGENNLEEEIYGELKNSCNSLNILFKKGIKEFFNSLFSDLTYLENIIDILIDTSLKKINCILDLIHDESTSLINGYYKGIQFLIRMACSDFTDEQKKIWKELSNLYKQFRNNLIDTKSEILKILNQKK